MTKYNKILWRQQQRNSIYCGPGMSLQISDLLNMASISIDANPACWIYVFLTAACDRFDTIHTRFSANCFLGLYLTVCKRTIPSYLVIFQVTGKCLNLYLSRRKRPNSTKDKRKVSNPSFTVDFFLSTPSFAVPCSSYCHWRLWWKLRCFLIGHLMCVSGTHLSSCLTLQDVFPCWFWRLTSHLDKVVCDFVLLFEILQVLESTRPGVEIPV